MKIGDKVRFLSESGGGIIAGFQSKNIALVEDEDGFQIPTSVTDLVVVNEDKQIKSLPGASNSADADLQLVEKQVDPNKRIIDEVNSKRIINSYRDANADELNVFIGIVPQDRHRLSDTVYYMYVINDSNYYISYAYSIADVDNWKLLSHNELEPNTKVLVSEIDSAKLSELENGAFQVYAYKSGCYFKLNPTMDVRLKIDPIKFYKLHSFIENDFFDEDAYIIDVIRKGKPVKPLTIDSKKLEEEIQTKKIDITSSARKTLSSKFKKNEPFVVDLHISQLLDSIDGMSHTEILNYQLDVFRKTLEEFKTQSGMKIIFIHGKGEGVLRNAIVKELRYRYKRYTYQDASFQEYGYGATQVTIH